jgi:uncharacterized DUF497 family protein
MEFEFDPAKSEANKAKHGIDFNEAIELWDDENRIEVPARTTDEPRFLVVGRIAGKLWSSVITYRSAKDSDRLSAAVPIGRGEAL